MRIYENTRALHTQIILWGAVAAVAGAVAWGVHSWRAQNMHAFEGALVVGIIFYVLLVGMIFFCRRYVIALDIEDGELVATTRGLTGHRRVRGAPVLGKRRRDKGLDPSTASKIAALTGTLDALRLSGVDNSYHFLELGPESRAYIVDVTSDPNYSERIASAVETLKSDGAPGVPAERGLVEMLAARTGPMTWVFAHLCVVCFVMAMVADQVHTRFYGLSEIAVATVTEKKQERAGHERRGAMEYFVRYAFDTAAGQPVTTRKEVEEGFYRRTDVDDRITVRYLPAQPTYNAVEFEAQSTAAYVLRVFTWLFGALAALFFVRGLVGPFPYLRTASGMLALGALACVAVAVAFRAYVPAMPGEVFETNAVITGKQALDADAAEAGGGFRHAVTYEYTDHGGEKRTAGEAVDAAFFEAHEEGDEIVLRYTLENPDQHDIAYSEFIRASFGFYFLAVLLAVVSGLWWLAARLFGRRRKAKSA